MQFRFEFNSPDVGRAPADGRGGRKTAKKLVPVISGNCQIPHSVSRYKNAVEMDLCTIYYIEAKKLRSACFGPEP